MKRLRLLLFLLILLAPLVFSFPTVVTVLDNFNRADATPLNGTWTHPLWSGDLDPKLISNQLAPFGVSATHSNAYWNTQYGPNCDVYVDIPTKVTDPNAMYLMLRVAEPGTTGIDGYLFYLATVTGAGPNDTWTIYRTTNNAHTALGATVTGPEIASGDSFGASAEGTTLKFWRKPAAGSWTEIVSRTDATYGSAGYFGVGMTSDSFSTCRYDNFSGGTISSAISPISRIFLRRRQ